jgi:hypothetical protein
MIVEEIRLVEETQFTAWEWTVFKEEMEGSEKLSQSVKGTGRRHLTRAPNACIPCRKSKTRVSTSLCAKVSAAHVFSVTMQNQAAQTAVRGEISLGKIRVNTLGLEREDMPSVR